MLSTIVVHSNLEFKRWWDKYESKENRPPEEVRIQRLAKRFKPWLSQEGAYLAVARLVETGKVVGFAGWQSTHESKNSKGLINLFRRDAVHLLGFDKREGWSDKEVKECWEAIQVEPWEKQWIEYDAVGSMTEVLFDSLSC